jgi:hypothetical protein
MKHRAITFAIAASFVSSLAFAGDTWTLDSTTSNARFGHGNTHQELEVLDVAH